MGSNRRRRRRRSQDGGGSGEGSPPPTRSADLKPGWRQTIDSWGGFTVLGSLAAAIVVVGALVVLNLPGGTSGGDWVPTERAQVDGRITGDQSAPVHIVEFADFQCPHCKAFWQDLEPTIYDEYVATGKAYFELHYFPFIGPESFAAASAAECAADQNRFWDYQDLLFLRQGALENQGTFSTAHLKDFAREIHSKFSDFNVDEFDQCVDSGRNDGLVQQMRQQAVDLGVSSTPTFLINGQLFANTTDLDAFRAAVDDALAAAPSGGGS